MFKGWNKYNYIFYIFSCVTLIIVTVIFRSSVLTLLASIIGLTSGMMNLKANKLCFLTYIVQAALYSYISFSNKFYGEAILAGLYLLPMYIYSAFRWIKKKPDNKDDSDLKVYKLEAKYYIWIIVAGAVITGGYGYLLSVFNSSAPYLNSLGTFMCIAAAFLTAKRVKEQWYFWIGYSISLAIIWAGTLSVNMDQIALLVQIVLYMGINIGGLLRWNKLYNDANPSLTKK
ncbi:MAG: nicotinamide riboside transporter PnuC [Clostridia bacterium]|jgi:nicotinamide mononucleotide transporter